MRDEREEMNGLTERVIGAAIAVHRALGPGLTELVYEKCLCVELGRRHIAFESQVVLPIPYRNIMIDRGLRIDLLVERRLIVELKSAERISPLFVSQTLTYLKLSKRRLGLIINFNVPVLHQGIRRIIL